jgi:hypothetical protein
MHLEIVGTISQGGDHWTDVEIRHQVCSKMFLVPNAKVRRLFLASNSVAFGSVRARLARARSTMPGRIRRSTAAAGARNQGNALSVLLE